MRNKDFQCRYDKFRGKRKRKKRKEKGDCTSLLVGKRYYMQLQVTYIIIYIYIYIYILIDNQVYDSKKANIGKN